MSRVSYQVPADAGVTEVARFRPVGDLAIATRRRDAKATVRVELSKPQARWLKRLAADVPPATPAAVMRALVDLAMDLEIDWRSVGDAQALRDAIRDAVLVRQRG